MFSTLQINRKDSKQENMKHINHPALKKSEDLTARLCATPPQNRRKIFNTKNLRSPFGSHRRTASTTGTIENACDRSGRITRIIFIVFIIMQIYIHLLHE